MKLSHGVPSSFQSHFAAIPTIHRPRSAFKLDHGYKTTFNAGYLIPVLWDEVNPGDTVKLSMTAFIRFATLLFPLMDNVRFYSYYFFIPNRLLWTNWQRFMGERDPNPDSSIDYIVPKMVPPVGGYTEQSIYDYFGLPTKVEGYAHISLPLRAYNMCWNYWFRDQTIQDSVPFHTGDTDDPVADYVLLRTNKIRDYFTSGLPFTQKGDPVEVPLGTTAPVISSGTYPYLNDGAEDHIMNMLSGTPNVQWNTTPTTSGSVVFGRVTDPAATGLICDLSTATASTINAWRQAWQLQRFLERDARCGTRYRELLLGHWGVSNGDLRMMWPLYLGGSSDPLRISVVAQTAPSETGGTPLASLSGFGTAVLHDHGFTKSFTEHGQLLGLLVARADINYQQGLNKKWSRNNRYSYPFPVFAHLGEQAILNKEIYVTSNDGPTNNAVFAYNERYAENRYFPNIITSLFRSNATLSLDSWHLAQDFSSVPLLNSAFLEDNPPTSRVKATDTDPDFIMDIHFRQTLVSTLPTHGEPGYVDHF